LIAANHLNASTRVVRIRPIALPVEHGGWALLFEPIVLGVLLAPSLTGLWVSVVAIGAFLARHPFKLAIADWRRNRRTIRTPLAERFAIFYLVITTLALALAIKTGGVKFLLPLLFAAPIVLVQLFNDSKGQSRALIAELAGAISTGAVATAIAISGGWPHPVAFGLWVIMAARNVPTILYLRARLRILHRKPGSSQGVLIAHVLAIFIVIGLARAEMASWLAVIALAMLLLRAAIGFSKSGRQVTAKKLGLCEVGFGAMTVFAVVLGHFVDW